MPVPISVNNLFAAAAFVFSIATGWIALYLLFWLFPTRPLVPRPVPSTTASTMDTTYEPPRTFWTMSFPTLRISTTRFTRFLALPRHVRWLGRLFYLLGAVMSLMFLGFLGARLVLEGVSALVDTSAWIGEMGDLPMDAALADEDLFGDLDAPPFLTIPGINLPSSLWRPFLIAVFGSLLFHELGHSLAASAWNLPTHSISFYVHLIFPSASVNFSNVRLQSASPLSRLAIAAAGIWHNIILALLCMTLIARPWLWLSLSGFAEVPGDLRGVLVISADPPLDAILPPYSRLVAVNDHPVTSTHDLAQIALEVVPPLRQCLVPSVFPVPADSDSAPPIPLAPCCLPPESPSSDPSLDAHNWLCFFHPSTLASACISPSDVSPYQCAGDRDCPVGFCMASHLPHDPRARLLDLNVTAPGSGPRPRPDQQQRVLWMGDPEDLARRVRVGRVVSTGAAAGALLPDWWPYFVVSVLELTVQASLSLAVVNAVPVGPLDGRELLVAILAVLVKAWRAVTARESLEGEDDEGREEEERRRRDGLRGRASTGQQSGEASEAVVTTGPPRPKLRPRYLSNNFGTPRGTAAGLTDAESLAIHRADTLPFDSRDIYDTLPLDACDRGPLADSEFHHQHQHPSIVSYASKCPKFISVRNLSIACHDTLPLDDSTLLPTSSPFIKHDTLLPGAESDANLIHPTSFHLSSHDTQGGIAPNDPSNPFHSYHFRSHPARFSAASLGAARAHQLTHSSEPAHVVPAPSLVTAHQSMANESEQQWPKVSDRDHLQSVYALLARMPTVQLPNEEVDTDGL